MGGKLVMKPLRDRTHRMPQSKDSGFKQEGGGAEVFGTPTFSVVETKLLSFSLVEARTNMHILRVFFGTFQLSVLSLLLNVFLHYFT